MPKNRKQCSPKREPEDVDWLQDKTSPPRSLQPAVSLQLPTFWEERPTQWFLHIEAIFRLRRLQDDDDMFNYVVAALTSTATTKLTGLLTHPPTKDKYTVIKNRLLRAFVLPEMERANRLFAINGLGSRTPSELKEYIDELVGEDGPAFVFKHFILRQLPANVRAALTNTPADDLDAYIEEADRVYLATRGDGGSHNPSFPVYTSPAYQGKKLDNYRKTRPPAASPPNRSGMCHFHAKYGQLARRCDPPCSFQDQGNGKAGVRPSL